MFKFLFFKQKKLNILKGKTIKIYRDSLENMKGSSPTNNNNKKKQHNNMKYNKIKIRFLNSIPISIQIYILHTEI